MNLCMNDAHDGCLSEKLLKRFSRAPGSNRIHDLCNTVLAIPAWNSENLFNRRYS